MSCLERGPRPRARGAGEGDGEARAVPRTGEARRGEARRGEARRGEGQGEGVPLGRPAPRPSASPPTHELRAAKSWMRSLLLNHALIRHAPLQQRGNALTETKIRHVRRAHKAN